eukprot:5069693-Lingulodinium_polyedra.AAC.1
MAWGDRRTTRQKPAENWHTASLCTQTRPAMASIKRPEKCTRVMGQRWEQTQHMPDPWRALSTP